MIEGGEAAVLGDLWRECHRCCRCPFTAMVWLHIRNTTLLAQLVKEGVRVKVAE